MSYWREGKEQVIYFLKNVPFSPQAAAPEQGGQLLKKSRPERN
jgi:hypothetical protein